MIQDGTLHLRNEAASSGKLVTKYKNVNKTFKTHKDREISADERF